MAQIFVVATIAGADDESCARRRRRDDGSHDESCGTSDSTEVGADVDDSI